VATPNAKPVGHPKEVSVTAYMQFGTTIKGDATLEAVDGWININSFQWKIDWSVTTRAGTDGPRDSKHPHIGELTIKKESDNSSRYLLDAITRNTYSSPKGEDCVIRFLSTGQGRNINEMIYQEFTFFESLITSIQFDSSGDRPVETITLNFTGIAMKVWPHGRGNMSRDDPKAPAAAVIFDRYNKIPAKR
jgi:type VI secretion system secreted protein Hcp